MAHQPNPVLSRVAAPQARTASSWAPRPAPGRSSWGSPDRGTPSSGWTGRAERLDRPSRRITIESVVLRTSLMLLVVVAVAAVVWYRVPVSSTLWFGAFLGALALSLVISIKQVTNPVVLLGFAALEGVVVGVVSKVFTQYAGGVVTQAILATLCTAAVVLALYAFRIVRVTNRMVRIVVAVTIGFVLTRLVLFALAATGIYPGGFDFGALDLILTLVGAGLAAFNLLLDFDFVERAVTSGMDEKYAWTAAFGLTVTLVWLYMEFLRLFSILRN